jgi:uncharacterized protein
MAEAPKPAAAADGADPSMEDILASIRRILNEEENPAATKGPEDTPADDDVLLLDQSMMVTAGAAEPDTFAAALRSEPQLTNPEPAMAVIPSLPEIEPPQPAMEAVTSVPLHEPPAAIAELVGAQAAAAAALSVGSLVRTLSAGRATQVYAGGPTLEDIVRAELRPLLKDWLDSYLPPMVERLVRAEIERVVGRAVP